ncbi:MAG: hypothetical protein H6Q18_829 [Bacteroidetes bacterium]|nr:hypothetical protein [Bacteroidota bacterium]
MKNIKYILVAFVVSAFLLSCGEEKLDTKSIFDTETSSVKNEFDTWVYNNYTVPYNIQIKYKFDDKESSNQYNLIPAKYENSIAMAILVKHLFLDAYTELKGADFLKKYSPRIFQYIGSGAYNADGSVIAGTAEGGLKITLYNVNTIDINNIDVNKLNDTYLKVIHHEFSHILHQTKSYSTDWNLISATNYQSGSWINVKDTAALKMGFISPYGSSEPQEDFATMVGGYLSTTDAEWQDLLNNVKAKDRVGALAGKAILLQKFTFIQDYMKTNWDIDIVKLKTIVLRRSSEVKTLDLKTLK